MPWSGLTVSHEGAIFRTGHSLSGLYYVHRHLVATHGPSCGITAQLYHSWAVIPWPVVYSRLQAVAGKLGGIKIGGLPRISTSRNVGEFKFGGSVRYRHAYIRV